jgi:HEAT repeat protein
MFIKKVVRSLRGLVNVNARIGSLVVIFLFCVTTIHADQADELIGKLKGSVPAERELAAQKLIQLHEPRTVEPLIGCLQDNDPIVRHLAAFIAPLIGCMYDENVKVRRYAISTLMNKASLADVRDGEPIIACLKDPDSNVREHVIWTLGNFAHDHLIGAKDIELLTALLKDPDENVRQAVSEVLSKVDKPDSEGAGYPHP